MRTRLAYKMVLAVTVAVGFSTAARAQGDSPKPKPQAEQQKPALKSHAHKVWTNDDISSVRSPADIYMDAKYMTQAAEDAASKQPAAAKRVQHVSARALSNPKTVDDADKMIAWEKRDVDSQTEYVELLKKQIDAAPQEDKERLKNLLQERIQILADTRSELEELVEQKKELQKKSAENSNNQAAQPSSQ